MASSESLLTLYDDVISKMDGSETTLNQTHCSTISKLSQDHLDVIYLLILHHFHLKGKPGKTELPYGAKTISNGKGINYRKFNQLPDDLQKIICRYLLLVSNQ